MKEALQAIRKYKRFLVTAHVNLEGDSLGSQLAMKALLEGMGKEAVIVDSDAVPDHYRFLARTDEVMGVKAAIPSCDAIIVLDCPTLKRIGDVQGLITATMPIINIDHHVSNEKFGTVNWVDPHASSAGEMVHRLFKETRTPITKETALFLYIAILTDTGSFNYNNTSGATHAVASELLGYGLEPSSISESIYERRSIADIKLLGLVLSSITVTKTGDVAYLEITERMLRATGADVSKSEGFINYARSIENVKVAVFFREEALPRPKVSISFRSKGDVDVNVIASYFGGGGHMRASGCVIEGSLTAVKRKVLARIASSLAGKKA